MGHGGAGRARRREGGGGGGKSAGEDSREAARGAMRDAGKLILDVTSDDLATMLRAKDEGNAAGARFEPLLDAFLLDLGR